ncbi:acetate---CoA ligase [Synchytrium microbalum]|uniref:Acetyl-coenzyme A synthetase n=1 Tax=Synchytrium microbalum TaxID=1806994 RepID=A0A507BSC6_9FUNG|nr:acetate---CoA ligase [Synchytrium microbalum]TPX30271.1 acetate---CoA ligase [Synchytrium microbalum]
MDIDMEKMEEHADGSTRVFKPPQLRSGQPAPHIKSIDEYKALYDQSIKDPNAFWTKMATELLTWQRPFDHVSSGSFDDGDASWFQGGQLNVSYNCVDRWAEKDPNRVAIIWESDEPGNVEKMTYKQLLSEICKFANVLKKYGTRKGDIVCIYMPMVPEAVIAMLACTRIGAVHSVVFGGFSADALRDRMQDASCTLLITSDEGRRGGKTVHLKRIADDALKECPLVTKVIVHQRTANPDVPMQEGRDVYWSDEVEEQRPVCPPERMESEDPLFMLYTSGSTGKPKGVVHTTAGYLLGVTITAKYIFDLHEGDIHACMADVGWITGHSYIVYGPLSNGVTTLLFESVPTFPTPARYWQCIQDHRITQFYTAPTAIRALRRLGDDFVTPYDLSSLRVIGSVGEPINPEAWLWYYNMVGRGNAAVVDTYWQTETGSIIISPLPGSHSVKPGSATLPFFGVDLAILDPTTGVEMPGAATGVLVVKNTFPSIARTVYQNHARYLDTYMKPYKGYYFTGDGVSRDNDGYYWIRGRVDDVINISGHRMSTAEIESALVLHPSCAEAAVVGIHDDITGQALVCFCTPKSHYVEHHEMAKSLAAQVRIYIGPFATPKKVIVTPDLPKTRSGKIMRRILRKIAGMEVTKEDLDNDEKIRHVLGDTSTLADPLIVPILIQKMSMT